MHFCGGTQRSYIQGNGSDYYADQAIIFNLWLNIFFTIIISYSHDLIPLISAIDIYSWSALFLDSISTDCSVFVDRLPAFRPAEVGRHMYWDIKVKNWTLLRFAQSSATTNQLRRGLIYRSRAYPFPNGEHIVNFLLLKINFKKFDVEKLGSQKKLESVKLIKQINF